MHGIENLLVQWRKSGTDTLTQGLYRIRITLEGNRLLNTYQTALTSAVRDLRVPGRAEPLDIESIYVPLRVAKYSHQRMASTEQETEQSDQVLARTLPAEDALRGSPHMLLLGQPGSGKSTTLRNLALRFVREEVPADYVRQLTLGLQDKPLERLLPIMVSLPEFARSDLDLLAHLTEIFAAHQVPYPHFFLTDRLERGECVLLMDDLDKIAEEKQRARVTAEIQHLTNRYPFNPVIVTSRQDDDQGLSLRFRRWWVLGLDDVGIDDLVARLYAGHQERAQALLRTMDRNQQLHSLAANPLFLSVLLVGHESDQEQPVRCAALYEGLLRVLLGQDEASAFEPALKKLFLQELALELHTRRARSLGKGELLDKMQATLSRTTQTADRADQLLNELVSANILWPDPGDAYKFAHSAFQEYLAARAVFERSNLETLAGHVDDPWYEEVFVLLAGLQGEAHELIGLIRERSQNPRRGLFLATRCLVEAGRTDGDLGAEIERELFELFQEEAPELWEKAAAGIAGIEDKSVEGALVGFLRAQGPERRQNAARALGRVGKEWAIAPLLGALEDPIPEVRKGVAWALGQIRDERAIHPLIRVFDDRDQGVAEEAALAVAAMGRPTVEPLIRSLSAPEEQVRRVTMMALSQIGAPAISLLIEALGDERREVREGAKLALIKIGKPGVEQLVETFAKARDALVREIVDVLVEICDPRAVKPIINALPDAQAEMQQVLRRALVIFGEPAANALIEELLNLDSREAAMETLVAFEDLATAKLSVALEDKRWGMRWRAAQVLGELRRAEALEPLIGVLEDNRREVRRAATDALRKIGDTRAVKPLIAVLSDEDDSVRWEAAKALGELRDVRGIEPLIAALTDEAKSVRQNSASSLIEIGPAIVEPLIETLYERGSRSTGTYDYVVDILDKISTRYKTQNPLRADLAAVYCQLLTGKYTLNELLPSLRELSWWQHGSELYQLFRMLDSLTRCQGVEEVTIEKRDLDQLSNSIRWLSYSELRTWLRDLGRVVEDIAWHRASSIEKTRQDALLRAKTGAKRLEDLATAFADPEMRILREVSEHLHRLIIETLGLQTKRPTLQLILRTDQIRIADPNSLSVLAYDLENSGDAPAWNFSIALESPQGGELTVVKGVQQYPCQLDPGEKRQIEFYVTPGEARNWEPTLEVRYDDPRREGHFERLSGGRVDFYEDVNPYQPIGLSPYTPGKAVDNPEMLYGRDDVLDWVDQNLSGLHQENILVLHGQRRTGKTSVLLELERREPKTPRVFVRFNLEVAELESTGDLFYEMALQLHKKLSTEYDVPVREPIEEEYVSYPWRRFRDFHDELQACLGDTSVVLMVDEFDILIDKVRKDIVTQDVFRHIRWLMQESRSLNFVFTGAYELSKMLLDHRSFLFNIAKQQRIGCLAKNDAKSLIIKPMAGLLHYHPLAVEKILRVTAGHPYYIQYICDKLVHLARDRRKNYVDLSDVNEALEKLVEEIPGQIKWDYELLSRDEQVTMAALAFVSDAWTSVPTRDIETTLERHGFSVPNLSNVLRELKGQDFIQEKKVGQKHEYRFRMELLRVWLEQNDMLLRLKKEIG